MLTELVHQKNCKKHEMVTDLHTGEIACSSCGIVSLEPILDLGSESGGAKLSGLSKQYKSRCKKIIKND